MVTLFGVIKFGPLCLSVWAREGPLLGVSSSRRPGTIFGSQAARCLPQRSFSIAIVLFRIWPLAWQLVELVWILLASFLGLLVLVVLVVVGVVLSRLLGLLMAVQIGPLLSRHYRQEIKAVGQNPTDWGEEGGRFWLETMNLELALFVH